MTKRAFFIIIYLFSNCSQITCTCGCICILIYTYTVYIHKDVTRMNIKLHVHIGSSILQIFISINV